MSLVTKMYTKLFGEQVGIDEFGNLYFRSTKMLRGSGRENRWVYYNGIPIGSKIPGAWFLWLHYQADLPPNKNDLIEKSYHWEKNHLPNLTGTIFSYALRKDSGIKIKRNYTAWRPN